MPAGRSSGILLHPTSLPSEFGIGDLGPAAFQFVDWLKAARQSYWQVLPLGPVAAGDSPYQSPSSFAGNTQLISLERLVEDGLLSTAELDQARLPAAAMEQRCQFAEARERKRRALDLAFDALSRLPASHPLVDEFERFRVAEKAWLETTAEFLAIRQHTGEQSWNHWPVGRDRQPADLAALRQQLQSLIRQTEFEQFLFYRQWRALRAYARAAGVRFIGDVPIYVSYDSADVWAHRDVFELDSIGEPLRVAGVPPDYFSATGQLWNNPLYNWDHLRQTGYQWWIDRVWGALQTVDLLRIDHFRGFEAYWAVPRGETTAINGQWVPGPRDEFFSALRHGLESRLGAQGADHALPLIAEDLGMITEDVHALRRRSQLPGMKVLQFILASDDPFEPGGFEQDSVAYTGTHDNDTTLGWYRTEIESREPRIQRLRQWIPATEQSIAWDLIRLAWQSGSSLAIAPLQDVLNLGGFARMNTPGTWGDEFHNWSWQAAPGACTGQLADRLAALTEDLGRAESSTNPS